MKLIGVYLIRVGASFYVGSSADIGTRWCRHLYLLKRGIHRNRSLQAAYDLCGGADLEILEAVDVSQCAAKSEIRDKIRDAEMKHISLMSSDKGMCNIYLSSRGPHRRDDMKERWKDPNYRERTIAAIRAGLSSPEVRAKLSKAGRMAKPANCKPVRIFSPRGVALDFASVTDAASHLRVSHSNQKNWLDGSSPFPGAGKYTTRKKFRRLIGYSVFYT